MTKKPAKAPDDPGAFGMLTPVETRILEGAGYQLVARLAKTRRVPSDWSHSLLLEIHRLLFADVFPEHAGKLRHEDVTFRSHRLPTSEPVPYRLANLVTEARTIIADAQLLEPSRRITEIVPRIASFHAACVLTQPFIDGNKRWARQVLNAILTDCGFYPGTEITGDQRAAYLEAIDKAAEGDIDQLENLIYSGWLALRQQFRAGTY